MLSSPPSRNGAHAGPAAPFPPERMVPVLTALQRIGEVSGRPAEGERLFRVIAEQMGAVGGGSAITAVPGPEPGALRLRVGTGAFAGEEGELLAVDAGLAGAAFQSKATRASADVASDPAAFLVEREFPVGPCLAVPLVTDGRAVGVALVGRAPGQPPFTGDDRAALEFVASAAAGAVAGADAHEARRRSRTALDAWRAERAVRERGERLSAALALSGVLAFEYERATGATRFTGDPAGVPGLAPAELGGRLDGWLGRVHPEDRPRLAAVLRGGEALPRRLRLRMADARQAVRLFELAVGAAPGSADGELLLCTLREVEREVVREPAPEPAPAPEPGLDPALLQALVRAVRHELDQPLSVVAAEAQRLRGEWIIQAEPALEHPVEAIHSAARRLCDFAARLAEVERDPAALVVTGEGGVAVRPSPDAEPAPEARATSAEPAAAR